jgi:hypothetical protein
MLKENGIQLLEKFNKPQDFDKLSLAEDNVYNLKQNVQTNIHKLISEDHQLNDLEVQTKDMNEEAGKFEKNAKLLEREMFWRKVKWTAIIVAIVIAVILIIVLSITLG